MIAPVLRVEGLTTSFRVDGKWVSVVRDVGFEIGKGETVAVVGESGSGKSVTALSIMRLVQRGVGRVLLITRHLGRDTKLVPAIRS